MEIAKNPCTAWFTGVGRCARVQRKDARQMKIQGNGDLLGRVRVEQPTSPSACAPKGFGEILKNTLNQASAAATVPGGPVSVQLRPVDPTAVGSVTARLEGFLGLMDEYRSKLADPRVSLKELDPLVRSLEKGRDALAPLVSSLPEDDGLKDILNRTLVTTEIEIMRFRRGDYLPA